MVSIDELFVFSDAADGFSPVCDGSFRFSNIAQMIFCWWDLRGIRSLVAFHSILTARIESSGLRHGIRWQELHKHKINQLLLYCFSSNPRSPALIAQLGERQTEDLKVLCSIHSQGIFC